MRVQLSSGEAKVRVFFGTHDDGRRTTTVQIDRADGTHIERTALCSFKDQFSRRMGRKVALQRVFIPTGFYGVLSLALHALFPLKADRRALWQAICPDFYRTPRNGRGSV